MTRRTCLYAAACFAVVLAAGFMVGCNASCGIGGEKGKEAGTAVSQAVSDAGDVIANVPGVGILGSLLKILGGVGVAYFGTKAVAKKEVKKYDEAPFTAEDAANIERAKVAAVVPVAAPPKA